MPSHIAGNTAIIQQVGRFYPRQGYDMKGFKFIVAPEFFQDTKRCRLSDLHHLFKKKQILNRAEKTPEKLL